MMNINGNDHVREKAKRLMLFVIMTALIGLSSCGKKVVYVYVHEDAKYWHQKYQETKRQLDNCIEIVREDLKRYERK